MAKLLSRLVALVGASVSPAYWRVVRKALSMRREQGWRLSARCTHKEAMADLLEDSLSHTRESKKQWSLYCLVNFPTQETF
jgi:hypothetical protein